MEGMKFLVVRTIDADNSDTGSYVVAVDAVGAGVGEVVMYASGSSARQTTLHQGQALRRGDHGHRRHLGGRRRDPFTK